MSNRVISMVLVVWLVFSNITIILSQDDLTKGLNTITAKSLLQNTKYLSSDKFKGRLQGTQEYDAAAQYVASKFKENGLKPVGSEDFLHYFTEEFNDIKRARLALINDDGFEVKVYKLGDDFICRGFTGSGNIKAEVVFCGYGLETNEYNDYRSIDVRGKIVMVFKTVPSWTKGSKSWGDTSPRAKARIAKENGAVAMLLINQPNDLPKRILAGSVACGDKPHLPDFPMLQVSNGVVEILLSKLNQSVSELQGRINNSQAPYSVELGTKVSIKVDAEYHPEVKTSNVIGFLEGTGKKLEDDYIIVGAHLDHVGQQTDKLIFSGANDNASGVASILEIAQALKESGIKLKRSIVFVAFSSEESGLRGSKNFVDNTPVPIEKIKVMLNFDCVGEGDSISVGGKNSFPKLWKISADLDQKNTKLLSRKTFGGGGADAEAFYRAGIPTLYFNTSNGYNQLHLPSDKVETLNPLLFEKLTKLGFLTIVELANGNYDGEKDQMTK